MVKKNIKNNDKYDFLKKKNKQKNIKKKFIHFIKNKLKKKENFLKKKKIKRKSNFFAFLAKKRKKLKKPRKLKIIQHLYRNRKLKKSVFLKEPTFNSIKYPINFNFKLISEFLKKK